MKTSKQVLLFRDAMLFIHSKLNLCIAPPNVLDTLILDGRLFHNAAQL